MKPEQHTTILLETMAGKGSEIGSRFEELRRVIDGVHLPEKVGVCLDIEIPWQILHAPQIVRHHFTTKLPHALISRASIHRIWRMGQYIGKLMILRQFQNCVVS